MKVKIEKLDDFLIVKRNSSSKTKGPKISSERFYKIFCAQVNTCKNGAKALEASQRKNKKENYTKKYGKAVICAL